MVLNAVLCVALYALMGFVGPAVASVAVNVGMTAVLIRLSLREMDGGLATAFDAGALGLYALSTLAAALGGWALRRALVALGLPALVITVLVMCAVSAAVLLINIKSLAASLRALNSMK